MGSPVRAKGKVTIIEQLLNNESDHFGYKVVGSSDGTQEIDIKPIEITKDVLSYYGFIYQYGSWVFKAKKHEVIIGGDRNCLIDRKDVGNVNYLHELMNLLYDNCDQFVLKWFYVKEMNEDPTDDSDLNPIVLE